MAYFLGRDVNVKLTSENTNYGVDVDGTASADGADGTFAARRAQTGVTVSDLTGVDIGLAVTDEDITYIGKKTVLKAEIKRETTVSLTKKKSDMAWDKVFELARWGMDANAAGSGNAVIHAGLTEPPAEAVGGAEDFGYALVCTLSNSSSLTVHNAQITGHTVSLNADGTTEETLEFVSYSDVVVAG